ncbi:MAG: peptidoglycan DD-metalloendopeptidase family protein [Pelolinea sp.]|nr:peptidoglycan DD-metalloendopeptidase family protein [Pelolinea sp.]
MAKKTTSIIIALILIFLNLSVSFAQESTDNPIYIVQPGENLTEIADKFNVSVQEIISINGIIDSNLISVGTELFIPGLEGVSGFLISYPVQIGESFQVLLRKYHLTTENFLKLNKLTSPAEIFVGTNLILPSNDQDGQNLNSSFSISKESSTFGQAVIHKQNRWFVNKFNDNNFSIGIPGESFYFPSEDAANLSSPFSPYIQSIKLSPLPIVQGHTSVIKVTSSLPVELTGELDNHVLRFFLDPTNQFYYALDGIHALEEQGLVDLKINGVFENGEIFQVDQKVLLSLGGYVEESLSVKYTFIDEELNIQESKRIDDLLEPVSDEKLWIETFRFPVDGSLSDQTIAFSSYFGNRRSYNSGQYFGFHGGLDFTVVLNSLNIYAPAPGVVIFTGPMDIRGNTTFIDHGQGVVSGYAHQIEILVEKDQRVETGQLIGKIGNTGRVTGPHLHWDIWVNGNQVDPFDWVENIYP